MTPKKTATTVRGKGAWKRVAVVTTSELTTVVPSLAALLSEVRVLILETRQTVARGVNSALVLLYWQIGQRIRSDILKQKRAEYGEQIVHAVSTKLAEEFGRGQQLPTKQLVKKLHEAVRLVRQWLQATRNGTVEGSA